MNITAMKLLLPSATRGTLFEKTVPLDPLQKRLINFIRLRVWPRHHEEVLEE